MRDAKTVLINLGTETFDLDANFGICFFKFTRGAWRTFFDAIVLRADRIQWSWSCPVTVESIRSAPCIVGAGCRLPIESREWMLGRRAGASHHVLCSWRGSSMTRFVVLRGASDTNNLNADKTQNIELRHTRGANRIACDRWSSDVIGDRRNNVMVAWWQREKISESKIKCHCSGDFNIVPWWP